MLLLMLASVGNLVNKTMWMPSLTKKAGQIMNSYNVHSNKRLIYTYFWYLGLFCFFKLHILSKWMFPQSFLFHTKPTGMFFHVGITGYGYTFILCNEVKQEEITIKSVQHVIWVMNIGPVTYRSGNSWTENYLCLLTQRKWKLGHWGANHAWSCSPDSNPAVVYHKIGSVFSPWIRMSPCEVTIA